MIERLAGRQLVRVGQLVCGKPGRPATTRPWVSNIRICACASSGARPCWTMAETIRSARPMAAEPAPRKRMRWSLSLPAGDLEGVEQAGERDACRALDVVVVAAHLVAVAGQQVDGVGCRSSPRSGCSRAGTPPAPPPRTRPRRRTAPRSRGAAAAARGRADR